MKALCQIKKNLSSKKPSVLHCNTDKLQIHVISQCKSDRAVQSCVLDKRFCITHRFNIRYFWASRDIFCCVWLEWYQSKEKNCDFDGGIIEVLQCNNMEKSQKITFTLLENHFHRSCHKTKALPYSLASLACHLLVGNTIWLTFSLMLTLNNFGSNGYYRKLRCH